MEQQGVYTPQVYELASTDNSALREMALAGTDHNYLLAYSKMNASAVPRLFARILDDAPVLSIPKLLSGQVTLSLDAPAERTYEVESSTDLWHWTSEGSQSNQLGSLQFTIPTLGPRAFYRARRVGQRRQARVANVHGQPSDKSCRQTRLEFSRRAL